MPRILPIYLISLCLGFTASSHAELYKHVDPAGNITYTDVPPKEGAEPIELPPINTIDAPKLPPQNLAPSEPPAAASYTSFAILTPAADATVRDNSGAVSVSVSLKPALRPGHQIQIYLDGAERAAGAASSVTLNEVALGTHSLAAKVVDQQGKILIEAAPVQFHLRRHGGQTGENATGMPKAPRLPTTPQAPRAPAPGSSKPPPAPQTP